MQQRYRVVQRQRNGKPRFNAHWHYQHEGHSLIHGRVLCRPAEGQGIYADEHRWAVGANGQQATCPQCVKLMARLVALIPSNTA